MYSPRTLAPRSHPSRFIAASWSRRGAGYRDSRFIATLASLCVVRAAEKSFPESWLRRALLTERQILLDWARLGEAANGFLEAPNDTLKASRREEHV